MVASMVVITLFLPRVLCCNVVLVNSSVAVSWKCVYSDKTSPSACAIEIVKRWFLTLHVMVAYRSIGQYHTAHSNRRLNRKNGIAKEASSQDYNIHFSCSGRGYQLTSTHTGKGKHSR